MKINCIKKEYKNYILKSIKKGDIVNFIIWINLMIIIALLTPINSVIYKKVIDNFLAIDKDINAVIFYTIVSYVGIQFIQEFLESLQRYVEIKVNYGMNNFFIKLTNNKLNVIGLEEYEKPDVYNLIERLNKKNNEIESVISNIIGIISPLLTIITYIIIMYNIKWYFALLITISFIPYFLIVKKNSENKYNRDIEESKKYRKLKYFDQILSDRLYLKELRIFKAQNYFIRLSENLRNDLCKSQINLVIKNYKTLISPHLFSNFVLALCLILISYDFIKGNNNSLGDIVLVVNSIQNIESNINIITMNMSNLYDIKFVLKDWKNFFELNDEIEKNLKEEKIDDFNIRFENVSYKYPGTENYVLKNVSFSIKENEKVALVGSNGSGKTTIVNLLMGFYRAEEGEIYVGDKLIESIINQFRSLVSCVFQNYNRYFLSVKDNILAGNAGEENTESNIKKFNIYNFINKMENKEKTILGQIYEGGKELSGGEWQKVALLRGLYKKNIKMMILDEPTASLDPITENSIYEDFSKICDKKALLLISHRLSAVKLCDKIIVLDKGTVVEEGSHRDLIEKKGKYYEMYQSQKNIY